MADTNRKLISICISTYEMGGHGAEFLENNFKRLAAQTFKDFDVVISDQSRNSAIKDLCARYAGTLDIKYFQNTDYGNSSSNNNGAIRHATGRLIKILFLDDYLYKDTSLEEIAKGFDLEKDSWLATASINTKDGASYFRPHLPSYDDGKILFKNTIGAPSVITIKNESPVLFEGDLVWWQDIDYYKRCFARFGAPKILPETNVVVRVHAAQMSNTMATEKRREDEFAHVLKKYSVKNRFWLLAEYRIRRYARLIRQSIKPAASAKNP